jgi:predicted nucleic-acid-binding protein
MQDDPGQSAAATRIVESLTTEKRGFISVVTLVEAVWVLATVYKFDRQRIGDFVDDLLHVREFAVERADLVIRALYLFRHGSAGFSDGLISLVCQSAGCDQVFTFDRKAAKSAGMTLLEA